MACCLYFFQCSRSWLALLVPILASLLSSGHVAFLIPITFIFLSTAFLLTFTKRKQSIPSNSLLKEAEHEALLSPDQEKHHQPTLQENSTETRKVRGDDKLEVLLMASHDLYSESESMDRFSSTSSEDHSSDIEQRLDCSDDDEESLFEIEIPTGEFFVCPEKDLRWRSVKSCHQEFRKEFWAEMNEEDNMIEIDIMMGSIKC